MCITRSLGPFPAAAYLPLRSRPRLFLEQTYVELRRLHFCFDRLLVVGNSG
jgi:hypothetical protein